MLARHRERMATVNQLQELLLQLKRAREVKGLSLSDLADSLASTAPRSRGSEPVNTPTLPWSRFGAPKAVGKRLVLSLTMLEQSVNRAK